MSDRTLTKNDPSPVRIRPGWHPGLRPLSPEKRAKRAEALFSARTDYVASLSDTLQDVAQRHGLPLHVVFSRSQREGWPALRVRTQGAVTARIFAKAIADRVEKRRCARSELIDIEPLPIED